MRCPDDGAELRRIDYRGILIQECETCRGRWFDRDELRKAKDKTDEDLRWLDFDPFGEGAERLAVRSEGKACPLDSSTMASLRYAKSDVVIDKCLRCEGIWLDHGEFEKIIKYLEYVANSESASEYVGDVFRQFVEIATGPEGAISEIRDFLAVLKLLELRIATEHPSLADAAQRMYQYWPLK